MIKGDTTSGGATMDPDTYRCDKLWKSVLTQAVKDACAAGTGMTGTDRDRARAWLASGSIDLRLVCDYADIEIDGVLKWARKCRDNKAWRPAGNPRPRRGRPRSMTA
jgi:hypothetical protein